MYDFSRAYLGDKGVLPVLKALEADWEFTGVIFRGCGIRNRGCNAIAAFVAERPQVINEA